MDAGWNTLGRWGLPSGPVRAVPRGPVPDDELRAALTTLRPELARLDERQRDALLAWLRGFRHHFEARFRVVFGTLGDDAIATLEATPIDANRYLKLRRIAIENLAAVL